MIPAISFEDAHFFDQIIIKDRDNFFELNETQLQAYPEITKLYLSNFHRTIKNSALKYIHENTFNNTKLEIINNQINILPWKLFQNPNIIEINIKGNPLTCDCNSAWIKHKLENFSKFFGPNGDKITCFDSENNVKSILEEHFDNCDLPKVNIEPREISLNEGETLEISCLAEGNPKPKIYWNIMDLNTYAMIEEKRNNMSASENADKNISSLVPFVEHRLLISSINRSFVGSIECIAENIVGKTVEKASVQLSGPPDIKNLTINHKFYYCLEYLIIAFPPAKRSWFFNGKPLMMSENIQDKEAPGPKNNGVYELRAFNDHGVTSKSVEFIIHSIKRNKNSNTLENDSDTKDFLKSKHFVAVIGVIIDLHTFQTFLLAFRKIYSHLKLILALGVSKLQTNFKFHLIKYCLSYSIYCCLILHKIAIEFNQLISFMLKT
ncbi:BDNF/NT-3 growth factors receptor-like protein [Dinothrombium tinctorium]|uniref:BDNF/NT-3 growth factors receptor-like protein n=1 Tax=Dinothrombium tinctorium TaxID=1965070 RepID=A0A3S3NZA1_9ACAR|nr:BDNF/NT-3 growth factors receptor-like protein [Dinothrombium tinctorium]